MSEDKKLVKIKIIKQIDGYEFQRIYNVDFQTAHTLFNTGVALLVDDDREKSKEQMFVDEYKKNPIIKEDFEDIKKPDEMPDVKLPGLGRTIKEFSMEVSQHFKGSEDMFYKPNENSIVEIVDYYDKMLRRDITTFRKVTSKRMLNLMEQKLKTHILVEKKEKLVRKDKSPNENTIAILLENTYFMDSLFKVQRFLNYPLLFLNDNKDIIIPTPGYDERFQAYFTPDTPKLELMDVNKAKEVILDVLKDFCFKEDIDKTIAISYLLTPACRGLYPTITTRSPIFLIKANRERAGKDYLAGVVGIIYEGRAIDDPPICTGDKYSNNNEELRKKITSAIRQGRRRIHSSNNKGHMANAILEQLSTSESWRDRELGKNSEFTLDNELDISLSANIGITYTPDLWHRTRPINLFFSEEDPNKRMFSNNDLHGFVKDNRQKILSAIYTLINGWVDDDMPISQEAIFTSFPHWARIVGSIMIYHKLGNPCVMLQDDGIGGDKESMDMKRLFEEMIERDSEQKGYTAHGIMKVITELQEHESIFPYMDLTERKYKTIFGILIQKYIGREFSGIIMKVNDINQRAARRLYIFGKVGNLGNVSGQSVHELKNNKIYRVVGEKLPTLPRLPQKPPKIPEIDLTPQNSQEFETNLIEFRNCSISGCQDSGTNPDEKGIAYCRDHWKGYANKSQS